MRQTFIFHNLQRFVKLLTTIKQFLLKFFTSTLREEDMWAGRRLASYWTQQVKRARYGEVCMQQRNRGSTWKKKRIKKKVWMNKWKRNKKRKKIWEKKIRETKQINILKNKKRRKKDHGVKQFWKMKAEWRMLKGAKEVNLTKAA